MTIFIAGKPIQSHGLMLHRLSNLPGDTAVNVRQRTVQHSPTGFEWGYLGSGCADLALNVVDTVLRGVKYPSAVGRAPFSGRTPLEATWQLYQPFKVDIIAPLHRDVGMIVIPYADIEAWFIGALGVLGLPMLHSGLEDEKPW